MRGRRPDPNTPSGRVRDYFAANPDEELTVADIIKKFGLTKRQVAGVLWNLKTQGKVRSTPVLYRGVK